MNFQILNLDHLPGKCKNIWWIKQPQYRLTHDVTFGKYTVPAGFIFDGLTVPWYLWWLCPTDHPNALPAALLHDYLCTSPHPCNSREAADLFYYAMLDNGMYKWGAFRNWLAVRYFGPRFNKET